MNYDNYVKNLEIIGAAQAQIGFLLEALKKHYDPEVKRDHMTEVTIDLAEKFYEQIKPRPLNEVVEELEIA